MRLTTIAVAVGLATLGLRAADRPAGSAGGLLDDPYASAYEVALPAEARTVTDLAVTPGGDLVVAGLTSAPGFPVTPGAADVTCGDPGSGSGCDDGFLMVLDPAGRVRHATFVGGAGVESNLAVTVGGDGSIWAVVDSSSLVIDERVGPACNGHQPVLLRVSADLRRYESVACVGGAEAELSAVDVALAHDATVWVAGMDCLGRSETREAWQPVAAGECDIYLARYRAGQPRPLVATYVGGRFLDYPTALTTTADGDPVVTGVTLSPDFPVVRPLQSQHGGERDPGHFDHDAILVRLDVTGRWVEYSTFIGGSDQDEGLALARDRDGNVYVGGSTWSEDFPATAPVTGSGGRQSEQGFLASVDANGRLRFSTLLGGAGADRALGVSVGEGPSLLVVGQTTAPDFLRNDLPAAGGSSPSPFGLPFALHADALGTRFFEPAVLAVDTGAPVPEGSTLENQVESTTADATSLYAAGKTRLWARNAVDGDWMCKETGHYVKRWRVG
jgi:hypothetical protein